MFVAVLSNTLSPVHQILVPPSLRSRAEIIFHPGRKENLAIFRYIRVRQCQGQWSRAADHGTIGRVLRAVTRAHELVVGRRPRDDATQVRADRVQTVRFQSLVVLDNQITAG